MKTGKILIFVSIIFMFFSLNFIYAEEKHESTILSIEKMNTIIDETIKEINLIKTKTYSTEIKHLYMSSTTPVTVKMFLDEFINSFNGNFIKKIDNDYLYPAGNSMWMSTEEWQALISDLNKEISYEEVLHILNKTKETHRFMTTHKNPFSVEDYKEIIFSLFPEFSEFIKYDENSIKNWFNMTLVKDKYFIFWPTNGFSNIIHELQHEIAAKEAQVYSTHGLNEQGKFSVSWTNLPEEFWYYNPVKEKWITINTLNLPYGNIINKKIPENIKNTDLYSLYLDNQTSASNVYSIYGMLSELISYSLELRFNTISESYDYIFPHVPGYYIKTTDFTINSIMQYLVSLKENNYNLYQKLVTDTEFITLIYDLYFYINENLTLIDTVKGEEEVIDNLKNWRKEICKDFLDIQMIPMPVFQNV